MTDRRFYYEAKMNIANVVSKDTRKRVFADIARDLVENDLKEGENDAQRVVASALESAFRSGRESAINAEKSATQRLMTEADIPEISSEAILAIRHAIFGTTVVGKRDCSPRAVALVFAGTGNNSIRDKAEASGWIQSGLSHVNQYSDEVIQPLVELGLITISPRQNAGILSEWGYEFIQTGKTLFPEHRTPAASSTSAEWAYLVRSGALRKGLAVLSNLEPRQEERAAPAFA